MSATKSTELVLIFLMSGLSNKEIGTRCGISESAVKYHVSRLMKKYRVTSRANLIVRIQKEGYEPPR